MSQREQSDAGVDWLAPITSPGREALSEHALVERLRLSVLSAGCVAAGAPAFALALVTVLAVPLSVVVAGLLIAAVSVPATRALAQGHRGVTGALLDRPLTASYEEVRGGILAPLRWARDRQRWRDLGFVLWSGTIGWLLALIPPALVTAPITYVVFLVIDPTRIWVLLFLLSFPMLALWWVITPGLPPLPAGHRRPPAARLGGGPDCARGCRRSRRPVPVRSTIRPRRSDASSAISTTAPRRASPPWA